MGLVPGGLAGIWVSGLLMATDHSDIFNFDLTTCPLTLALVAVSILVIVLMSLFPWIRSIRRLDVAAVVRE